MMTTGLCFLLLLRNIVQSYALQSMIDKTLVLLSNRQKGVVEDVDGID